MKQPNTIESYRERQIKLAKEIKNFYPSDLKEMKKRGFVSKQELRDKINLLENRARWQDKDLVKLYNERDELIDKAKRATIAAYALLVTLFIIVGVEVIW
jgi:hypothetical protein